MTEHDTTRPRTVAFYLPQFHAIPENDAWWGEGFTEWTNVRRGSPQFAGHEQPKVPGSLGYYALTEPAVLREQAHLARANGVDAFCFYYYRFGDRRLLERPVDDFVASDVDMTFCLSWANENWSRRWDGRAKDVLMAQDYSSSSTAAVAADLVRYASDPRYLRVRGAAVVLVHKVEDLPDPHGLAAAWRRAAEAAGVGPLHLVATETVRGLDPRDVGFDAVAEFPPVGSNTLGAMHPRPLDHGSTRFRGRVMSYPRVARRFTRRPAAPFVRYPGVMPAWDNTARRGGEATVFVGSSPSLYASWLAAARRREQAARGGDGLVFVNAWNEWAEGAYLEPDERHGDAYLRATRWSTVAPPPSSAELPPRGPLSSTFLLAVGRAGASSVLSRWRRATRVVKVRVRR